MPIQLFDHQKEAIDQLQTGCILCGGVGTGKSITAIAYYFCRVCGGSIDDDNYIPMKEPKDLYIITTARKRDTLEWEKELAPWLLSPKSESNYYDGKASVYIDSWNNIKKYTEVSGAFFILDEDKIIGNGAWVKAFYKIAAKNDWIVLTATPGDTWMDYIPIFIANGFYENRSDFIRQHVVYSRYSKYPKVDRYMEQGRLLRLRSKILVQMNFKKKTVANNKTIEVNYDRELYSLITRKRWNIYENRPIRNVSEFRQLRRRIVNTDESRGKAILDIFHEHPHVIIFYNFNYELDILRNLPYGNKVKIAEWNGQKHEPVPVEYELDGKTIKPFVYLVQYFAGAEGWNCIETDTIIFYSLHDSYKTMVQAAGRIDRLTTPFTDLYYYRLRSNAPIDRGISESLRKKKNFNEREFDKNEAPFPE